MTHVSGTTAGACMCGHYRWGLARHLQLLGQLSSVTLQATHLASTQGHKQLCYWQHQ